MGPPPPSATRGLGVYGIPLLPSGIRLANLVVNGLEHPYSPKLVEGWGSQKSKSLCPKALLAASLGRVRTSLAASAAFRAPPPGARGGSVLVAPL